MMLLLKILKIDTHYIKNKDQNYESYLQKNQNPFFINLNIVVEMEPLK